MEEVDSIIIDSLRNIECDVDIEIHSLKDFDSELIFNSFVYCLEVINPEIKFPHGLPPSMSLRLKLATNIAECIKDLGYRGDMGYQTILYCDETELRRVLMFLIERIPRDNKVTNKEKEEGYVTKLVRQIEKKIQESLHKPWVPSELLKFGVDDTEKLILRQNYGECFSFHTEVVKLPKTLEQHSEILKNYWIHSLPNVTEQCSFYKLVPSLLFSDAKFLQKHLLMNKYDVIKNLVKEDTLKKYEESSDNNIATLRQVANENIDEYEHQTESKLPLEEEMERIIQEIKAISKSKLVMEKEIKTAGAKLSQIKDDVIQQGELLKESQAKVQLKKKAQAVLSKQENLIKLKKIVESGSERLVELANQWHSVQTPLLNEYRSLINNHSDQELKILEENEKLEKIQEKNKQIVNEIKEKERLEQQLLNEFERINKNVNRSAYTKRIIEIIANIKKQEEDIKKILNDTRAVQKDLNNLNGQLERSFTLADELIFRDAKREETARKAYKLLATLHSECNQIVQTVTDLGVMEREARNLQDQVDIELSRETASKLERVLYDLSEVKKENEILAKQISKQQIN
ncbi:coiled-coil domain-containing protein 22 homolog [Agrilus planipennis]|uniref:Coiled-coil domain-containing protein 22 homolog n=1 Tax=Agrilus planipennis TaxID=224129 RepID=A0A1W4XW33_AGRPL|nr:coiled-coil domain-containing protein 22 homolog [Agrilus planipennis]XP_018336687.1 coiled-coil domain-containing protein 22 homolog [Agrilus planipennis]XP_018336688.1 coiled-coil domain-containing protein 22 homolog [Agrilus planipennis]